MASLEILTDEAIIDYTRRGNKNFILTDHRDFNARYSYLYPYRGGVYDPEIFGSAYSDRCYCGKLRQVSSDPCPECGAQVLSEEEALRRFARIELPFYYLNSLRFDVFKEFIDDLFSDTKVITKFTAEPVKLGFNSPGSRKLNQKVYDSCQFEYDEVNKELTITDTITDESKCSYEGLMKIITDHFPGKLTQYKEYINRLYLVLPSYMRPPSVTVQGRQKNIGIHKLTIWYELIVRLCCVANIEAKTSNYNRVMKMLKTPGERVRYTALLRALINFGRKEATDLLNSSKENLARDLYSVRVKNSLRCPIVPATDLPIDEVQLPRHLVYEMCRSGFVKFLVEQYKFTEEQAKFSTKEEAENPQLQKAFDEYVMGNPEKGIRQQCVIINRPPSLHEYNMIGVKVRIPPYDSVDYAMHLPLMLCEPLGGDYDGDQLSAYLIPEEIADETMKLMSPRYVTKYKKNLQNINVPSHEFLNGLAVATKIEFDDPSELKEPRLYYDSYVELLKDVEVNRKLSLNRLIVFNGTIDLPDGGKLEYRNQVTTLGRLRLSKMIGADIDTIPGLLKSSTDKPFGVIDGGAASRMVSYLQQYPDYIERLNEIQKYALRVVTAKGVVTFDFDTLYAETDNETYREIREIVDSPKYTDKQKSLLITEKYKEYLEKVKGTIREDVKADIKDANRVKIDSIVAMVAPAFIVSGVEETPIINKTTLVNGMTSKDYVYHAIENRSLQSIKQSSTPSSGFLSRQLRFLMSDYEYRLGEDPDNKCIMIPRYRSEGRVAPNGKLYPKFTGKPNEDDLVPVRSIVTKSKEFGTVTPDCISSLYHFDMKDYDPIGMSFATSLTQAITQHSLSLKHGGHERVLDESGFFKAPEGCRLIDDPDWLILSCRGGKELRYPKPTNFVLNFKAKYAKGDTIGTAYRTTSPIYTLNCLIKLMRARGSDGSRYYEKDNVLVSDCYAYEAGTIRYIKDKDSGEIIVKVGNIEYDYNPEAMYYFPDGAEVKQYERFCSGVSNIRKVTNDLQDPVKIYTIFRRQFYESSSGSYAKTGIISDGDNREEIVELTYVSLTSTKIAEDGTYDIDYKGVHSGIMDNDSFYTLLSYGYSGRVVSKALKGEVELKEDSSTRTILGLLLTNKLDE